MRICSSYSSSLLSSVIASCWLSGSDWTLAPSFTRVCVCRGTRCTLRIGSCCGSLCVHSFDRGKCGFRQVLLVILFLWPYSSSIRAFVDEVQIIFTIILPIPHSFRRECWLCGTFSSKHDSLVFSHERFESFGDVLIFVKSVLGRRPKWASNGVIFVVALGVIRSVLISSATSDASLYGFCFCRFS